MTEFFVVWKDGGGPPTVRHGRQYDAQAEAERLARTVGGRYYVLRAIGACVKSDIKWDMVNDTIDESECPF
jgi:hypothetical protein